MRCTFFGCRKTHSIQPGQTSLSFGPRAHTQMNAVYRFFFGCAAVVFASAVCIFLYYVIRNCFEPSFAVIANCIVAHNRIDCTKCNKKFVPISYRHRSGSGDIAFVCRRRLVRCSSELILLFSYSFALFLHYCHLPGRLLDRHTTYPFARSRSARMARRALESGWGSYTATHI